MPLNEKREGGPFARLHPKQGGTPHIYIKSGGKKVIAEPPRDFGANGANASLND